LQHSLLHEKDKRLIQMGKEEKILQKRKKSQELKCLKIEEEVNDQFRNFNDLNSKIQHFLLQRRQFDEKKKKLTSTQQQLHADTESLVRLREEAENVMALTQAGVQEIEKELQFDHKRAGSDRTLIEEMKRNMDIIQKEVNRVDHNNKK